MQQRTLKFAIACGRFCMGLPKNDINKNYSNQLIRSSASVAANYRALGRAKSTADFIHKLKIIEEEQDESLLWLELLEEFNKDKSDSLAVIHKEGEELLKIFVATIKTMKSKIVIKQS